MLVVHDPKMDKADSEQIEPLILQRCILLMKCLHIQTEDDQLIRVISV